MSDNNTTKVKGFTAEEKEAMKARMKELKAEERANKSRTQGENDILTVIKEMSESDRTIAKKIHELVKTNAPQLFPKTWYGMPAYADKEGKVICFFQAAGKFNTRYGSFGFNDTANLDDGNMWPTAFGIKGITQAEETKIAALIKKAIS